MWILGFYCAIKARFHDSDIFREKLFIRNRGGCTWIIPLNSLYARNFVSPLGRNQFYSLRRGKTEFNRTVLVQASVFRINREEFRRRGIRTARSESGENSLNCIDRLCCTGVSTWYEIVRFATKLKTNTCYKHLPHSDDWLDLELTPLKYMMSLVQVPLGFHGNIISHILLSYCLTAQR